MTTKLPEGRLLQVGDVIYRQKYGFITVFKIKRVSEKRAICGQLEFNRRIVEGGFLNLIDFNPHNNVIYSIENEELQLAYLLQQTRYNVRTLLEIKHSEVGSMSLEQLEALIKLLSPKNNKKEHAFSF